MRPEKTGLRDANTDCGGLQLEDDLKCITKKTICITLNTLDTTICSFGDVVLRLFLEAHLRKRFSKTKDMR
eukprot:scaffold13395_cov71-Cyclotella_meneghiniana.AAC.10